MTLTSSEPYPLASHEWELLVPGEGRLHSRLLQPGYDPEVTMGRLNEGSVLTRGYYHSSNTEMVTVLQ